MSLKQRKMKFIPRIQLNHNIYNLVPNLVESSWYLFLGKKKLKGFLKVNFVNCAPHVDMHVNIVKDEVIWDRKYGTIIIR